LKFAKRSKSSLVFGFFRAERVLLSSNQDEEEEGQEHYIYLLESFKTELTGDSF
jgi:hypothetical protein